MPSVQRTAGFDSQDEESPFVDPEILDTEDLEALAQEVYKLLREELLVERDRQGKHRIW